MPLLKKSSELSPPGLFDLAPTDYPWWVAHVRSRQEKALARYLDPLGVPFYLPLREERKRRAGRNLAAFLPVFPGYVFFRGGDGHRVTALKSNLLVRVLSVAEQDLLHWELGQLRDLQETGANLVPCEPIEPGQAVKVTQGPFSGYTGVVVRGKGALRLIVSVTMLRKAIAVELDREVLAPASRSQEVGGGSRLPFREGAALEGEMA